jgi:hypothetical protein
MPGRNGPRFALEAGFLILLAVLAGVADLRWQVIVLVMAIAWVLIALLEWAFWREGPRLPPVPRPYATWAPAPPPAAAPPAARDDETRVIRPEELAADEPADLPILPEPEPEPEPEAAAEPVAGDDPAVAEEPEPAPKRPWWWRRRDPDVEPEPAQPRHVRILPPERHEEDA